MCLLIMPENMLFYREIYTDGKNFTLLPVVPVVTNLSSLSVCTWLLRRTVQQRGAAQKLSWHSYMSFQYTIIHANLG